MRDPPVDEMIIYVPVARVANPDPDPYWIRIQSDQWIRIRIQIQEGKNDPQSRKNFMF
jgi:hypothetical protein